jgi:nickel-dependent lactate racemase
MKIGQHDVIGGSGVGDYLSEGEVRTLLDQALSHAALDGKRVLALIPDSTRTAPIPLLFRLLHELLCERVDALDYLVALGTHSVMSDEALNRLVGINAEERTGKYAGIRLFNHRWDEAGTFTTIGTISQEEIGQITQGMLAQPLPVTVNRLIFDYDVLFVLGPVFPHEVVGFSGGTKYFFPGISGADVINFTHWLGALITSMDVIGTQNTPVRAIIDRAVSFIDVPTLFFNQVVTHDGLAGLYIGDYPEAWQAAAEHSARLHIRTVDKPYQRVLSIMPEMYDDLWTAAKGMYKLEPVVADGGEVIIYAPHITEISYTHGRIIDEIGYHVRDYFVRQWDRFKDKPWGVLAHSTHLRGTGTYQDGIERPRIRVTLATGIPRQRCEKVNLGYLDPAAVDIDEWVGREDDGLLLVPRAGETLYRLRH